MKSFLQTYSRLAVCAGSFLVPVVSVHAQWNGNQDLFSGGANSWILHTPDDGRTTLHLAPGSNSTNWDWSKQALFYNNGDFIPGGRVGIGTQTLGTYANLTSVGGAVLISSTAHTADASLHISTSIGGFDRLTQIHPSASNKPALNLMASKSAGGAYQWWSWGVTPDNKWKILPGTNFGGSGGITLDAVGTIELNGKVSSGISFPGSLGADASYVGTGGNHLSFGHPGVSEDFIGYKDNTFYFKDSPGGGDVLDANVVIGGSVGIGTSNLDAKLAVKGTIHTQEVKVDLLGSMVPDYVFESNYQLPSLESVRTYIDENKHLPEVPSAKEMETNGMNVGEMNLLLLKKIEELTLYVIELKNITNKQSLEIEDLKKNDQRK